MEFYLYFDRDKRDQNITHDSDSYMDIGQDWIVDPLNENLQMFSFHQDLIVLS